MNGFPTRAPVELEDRPRRQQWLIDGLWGRQAVGIVGGEPKCGKSFLDLAVAVAGHIVRARLQGIASAGARFETLDIAVIEPPKAARYIEVLQTMSLPPSSAPIATGWSDPCRAGFAPAEGWRLSTAH